MNELGDMLKSILDDPSTTQKLQSLLGQTPQQQPEAMPDGIDPALILKVTNAVKKMNNGEGDNRTRLLKDLKPYMSPARAKRVDDAVDILKMLWLVDAFKGGKL